MRFRSGRCFGVLVAILLALASQTATAASAFRSTGEGSNDTPVVGLVTGANPTGHAVTWEKQQTTDASTIAEEAGHSGAHVILNGLTGSQAQPTMFNQQVTRRQSQLKVPRIRP
jgi:hypothetical protein